jgi:hypothetical protein
MHAVKIISRHRWPQLSSIFCGFFIAFWPVGPWTTAFARNIVGRDTELSNTYTNSYFGGCEGNATSCAALSTEELLCELQWGEQSDCTSRTHVQYVLYILIY